MRSGGTFGNCRVHGEHRSVTVIDDARSHWVVRAPAGHTVEWDSVITEESPGELIAWNPTDGRRYRATAAGSSFAIARDGRGTEVTRDDRLRPAGRRRRQADRQAVPEGAEDPGAPGSAPLQAADGDRRDRHLAMPPDAAPRA